MDTTIVATVPDLSGVRSCVRITDLLSEARKRDAWAKFGTIGFEGYVDAVAPGFSGRKLTPPPFKAVWHELLTDEAKG